MLGRIYMQSNFTLGRGAGLGNLAERSVRALHNRVALQRAHNCIHGRLEVVLVGNASPDAQISRRVLSDTLSEKLLVESIMNALWKVVQRVVCILVNRSLFGLFVPNT
jgi:hypothetical protein